MIRAALNRLADFLLADARAEHEQVGRISALPHPARKDHPHD